MNEILFAAWYAWDVVYDDFYNMFPPELEDEWELHVVPPTPDELEAINLVAEELRFDFAIA